MFPNTDVDIDVKPFDLQTVFPGAVRASNYQNGKLTSHPCGAYLQSVPTDPITGFAAAPYELAEQLGCFKLDFLHVHIYDHFESREEITELLKIDPDWSLLEIPSVVKQLFQVSKQYELLEQTKPRSVIELADVLALMRPQKRYMLKQYLLQPLKIREMLYNQESGESAGYAFKKAHAIAYALVIVLQLHLIKGGIKFGEV
jgi:hypothetical protein